MLEDLANLGEFIGGFAVIFSLVYIAFQLNQSRKQQRVDAMQRRIDVRVNIWLSQLNHETLQSARAKFFDLELYRRDARFHEIDELDPEERSALNLDLSVELVYFSNLFYQVDQGLLDPEQARPLTSMWILRSAPHRREWKDQIRLMDQFPQAFIRHVDSVVKQFDRVEKRMEEDEDADYLAVVQEVFGLSPPPDWLES